MSCKAGEKKCFDSLKSKNEVFCFVFFYTSNFTDTAGDAQKKNVVKFKYSEWIKLYSIHSISKQDLNMPYVSSSRGNWEYVEIRETRILQFVSKEVIFLFYRLLME